MSVVALDSGHERITGEYRKVTHEQLTRANAALRKAGIIPREKHVVRFLNRRLR